MKERANVYKDGFTIIELVIVLFIIGLASAVAAVAFTQGLDAVKLKASAKEVAATLRHAREQAVSQKNVYIFLIDKNSYALKADGDNVLENEKDDRLKFLMQRELRNGVAFQNSQDKPTKILFYPLGDSTGGHIYLKNSKGSAYRVSVEKLTARVSIAEAVSSELR
ncbi:MAG: GspH/FimT family pseudopilin [Dissulfurispiraceae bacterium]|jgi:general secretion pathway protein H|nr:GspH/FimT family pseudopilin [Dissulfurispiraceae bacterium]